MTTFQPDEMDVLVPSVADMGSMTELGDEHGFYHWQTEQMDRPYVVSWGDFPVPGSGERLQRVGMVNIEPPPSVGDLSAQLASLEREVEDLRNRLQEEESRSSEILVLVRQLTAILGSALSGGNDLRGEFELLAAQWEEETLGYSLAKNEILHPAYLRIIGMGEKAIPWILEEMMQRHGQWFTALQAITGEDPVPEEDRGRRPRMREAWQEWGRAHGWLD